MARADLPELQAAIVRRFRLREEYPEIDVQPIVVPVVQVDPITVNIPDVFRDTVFEASDVFTEDAGLGFVNAPLNHLYADTGQLPAGAYEIIADFTAEGTSPANASVALQHRNAANLANLAFWVMPITTLDGLANYRRHFTYRIGELERLRMINGFGAFGAGNLSVGQIMAKRVGD